MAPVHGQDESILRYWFCPTWPIDLMQSQLGQTFTDLVRIALKAKYLGLKLDGL